MVSVTIEDIGVEHEQYLIPIAPQGWVWTLGLGDTGAEAMEDALDQAAQMEWPEPVLTALDDEMNRILDDAGDDAHQSMCDLVDCGNEDQDDSACGECELHYYVLAAFDPKTVTDPDWRE